MRHLLATLAAAALAVTVVMGAAAHEFEAGDIVVHHPWATPSIAGQAQAAAYLTIQNQGMSDRLIGAHSPAAGRVMIHGQETVDDVSRMIPLDEVYLPTAAAVMFEPGGAHLMLVELNEPLAPGDSIPLTLEFEQAGAVEVTVVVETLADYLRRQAETGDPQDESAGAIAVHTDGAADDHAGHH